MTERTCVSRKMAEGRDHRFLTASPVYTHRVTRPRGPRAAACVLAMLAAFATRAGPSSAADLEKPAPVFLQKVLGEGDVVQIGHEVALATPVRVPPEKLVRLLADPAAYRRAVPAFVRADPVKADRAEGGQVGEDDGGGNLYDWELEIPLWNLEGRLRLEPRADGVDITLVEGDLCPGAFRLRVFPGNTTGTSTLLVAGRADLANANWMTRNVARRSPLAPPAMTATAVYVLGRGLALEAERPGSDPLPERWPPPRKKAPPASALSGRPLLEALGARFATASPGSPSGSARLGWTDIFAHVTRRPDGRLHHVTVAAPVSVGMDLALRRANAGERWRALPGWSDLEVKPLPAPAAPAAEAMWEVDSGLPFVDFDARWRVRFGPRLQGEAVGGDWRGPVLGFEVAPSGQNPRASLAALSLHPHIENTGYLPRKLVEAEPLLEHGLALALAYVNAVSLSQNLGPNETK